MILTGALFIVFDYFADVFGGTQMDTILVAKVGISSSFAFATLLALIGLNSTDSISTSTVFAYGLIFYGLHILFRPDSDIELLPMFKKSTHDHDHEHDHEHDHAHHYPIDITTFSLQDILANAEARRIFLYLSINFAFMFVEMIYGVWTNSLGLISDAFHMLFDCTALAIGLFASIVSRWSSNDNYTYGYGRVEVLSGFVNGVFLLFIAFSVIMEAISRIYEPPEIHSERLLLVSVLGFLVNIVGIYTFHDHGHSHSHNAEGVFLHIVADALGSVGVIISSSLIENFWMDVS